MDPSQANPREYQRQSIDAEIESLEASIQALTLRHRRNALTPVSSLPPEVISVIFSFLRVPVASLPLPLGEKPDHLSWLRVTHVCHYWREIALNQPLYWSHFDFTTVSSAGAAEILARAKTVPLYLEARVPGGSWDDARFSAFRKELQAHVSHICHLGISARQSRLRKTLKGLVSPASTLEYLSLSNEKSLRSLRTLSVPDTLFDGTTPRLSCLELRNCDISWESPLLKGLRYLEIHTLSADARPGLSVWLDALGEMPQLKTLTLDEASPIAPPDNSPPSDIERTVTLPSLTRFDISSPARDCGLALAHLVLPALTRLCLSASSCSRDGSDVQEIIPYVARHAHGSQDTQPLQSVVVRSNRACTKMLVWTVPDIDVRLPNPVAFDGAMLSVRVAFSVLNDGWSPGTQTRVFDAVMVALPLDSLVTLTSQSHTSPLNKQSWFQHAPRWSLLQRVRLAPFAAHGFREMLLEDNVGHESLLLPSLTRLTLVDTELSARRTLRLCDALMKRVEQGVPLETLDLRTCPATSRAVELLSEIVVDVLGPGKILETRAHMVSVWESAARGIFVENDSSASGVEDYDEDDPGTGSDDGWGAWDLWETDDDGD